MRDQALPLSKTPVIVIGRATTAISVQRLVAQAGYPVFAACSDGSWASTTKFFQPLPAENGLRWTGELGDAGLRQLRRLPFPKAILIPTADDAALWLSKLPTDLRDRFLVSGSTTETLEKLQDKRMFAKLTSELGVDCPRSYIVESSSDFGEIPFDDASSFFIKPCDSQIFSRKFDAKAVWAESKEQAAGLWDSMKLEEVGAIVQEYVPGGADQHFFIDGFRDRDGVIRAKLARQRFRIFPPDFGNSSFCASIDFELVNAAWSSLNTVLESVNYRGIFSAEFKKDANDGSFKLLEINTRAWVYIEFASVCGVNICDLYIRDATGLEVPDCDRYDVGPSCVDIYADFRAIRVADRESRPRVFSTLVAWFKSFKVIYSWSDLRPALHFLRERIGSKYFR